MRRNLYPGRCCGCKRVVPAGCGRLGRLRGRWAVVCECCGLLLDSHKREDKKITGENEKRPAAAHTTCCGAGAIGRGVAHN